MVDNLIIDYNVFFTSVLWKQI